MECLKIGIFLKKVREDRNIKAMDVMEALNIPKSTFYDYESGKYDPPLYVFKQFCDFYRLNSVQLLFNMEFIDITHCNNVTKQRIFELLRQDALNTEINDEL